jgi:hypothetical protein
MPTTQTAFTLAQLLKDRKEAYLEFLRVHECGFVHP